MSVDVSVFLRRERIPSLLAWQEQLDTYGVRLRLDTEVDPTNHAGYWPSELEGTQSGFEFYLGSVEDEFAAPIPTGIGDRDHVATFMTHSDVSELKCSMLAAAALAESADGLVFDEDTLGVMSGAELAAQALAIET